MLRVLHVVSYFPPDRMGGVGEVVAHVHRALLAAGHISTVLTTGDSSDEPAVRRVAHSPGGFAAVSLRFAALARNADIVHMHHGEGVGLLCAMRLLGIRTPVLLTLHVSVGVMRHSLGPYSVSGRRFRRGTLRSWLYRNVTMPVRSAMDRLAMALAHHTSFISRSAAVDMLGDEGGQRATVVYNGMPGPGSLGDPLPARVELLFVGTESERKRVELLPLILAAVRRSRPEARLRVVGFSREDNSEIVSLAQELRVLDAMEFIGRVPSGSLAPYYRAAQVLLVPSAYEGLPMVILEAMQHSIAVVATRVSGHPEVIEDGVNGLLVPLDDPDAMAGAALRLLEDEFFRSRLGARGKATVAERFSVGRQTAHYLSLYEQLAGASGASA